MQVDKFKVQGCFCFEGLEKFDAALIGRQVVFYRIDVICLSKQLGVIGYDDSFYF